MTPETIILVDMFNSEEVPSYYHAANNQDATQVRNALLDVLVKFSCMPSRPWMCVIIRT
jgi:hypothetical protein